MSKKDQFQNIEHQLRSMPKPNMDKDKKHEIEQTLTEYHSNLEPQKRRGTFMNRFVVSFASIAAVLLFAFITFTTINDNGPSGSDQPTNEVKQPDVNQTKEVIRAIGESDNGKILIKTTQKEIINQVETNTCYANAEDYHISGNYQVVYQKPNGDEQVISPFKGEITSPSTNPITLKKLEFDGFDAFYFTPKYTGCNPVPVFLYAIGDGEKAKTFKFVMQNDDASESFTILPNKLPEERDHFLMIPTKWPQSATETSQVFFEPDWENGAMRFVNQIKPEETTAPNLDEIFRSAEKVVETWAQGVKERDGKLQFNMLSETLQSKYRNKFEDKNWSTGLSSPWVEEFEVIQQSKSENKATYLVKLHMATSTGDAGITEINIELQQQNSKWAITKVTSDITMFNYNLIP